MSLDIKDTIVALASAAGPGGRAIVRLSGPTALAVAEAVFRSSAPIERSLPHRYGGTIQLPGVHSPLPADLYLWPGPGSYTGQQVVELHTLQAPPLIELLIAELLRAGGRAATPGEFTMRAFLAGKLDLPRAEAVVGVIEASNRDELKQALLQLAGGVTRPLQELRDDLLNLLADVEAALDFAEEDIQFVDQRELLLRMGKALALVTLAQKQLRQRAVSVRPFRAVLVGRPNAGKSSLFNALTGSQALIDAQPGTTRDYLVGKLEFGGVAAELVDTAGWQEATEPLAEQAQWLGREQADQADLLILCLEAGKMVTDGESQFMWRPGPPPVIAVTTKCDLAAGPPDRLATSARSGAGIESLRSLMAEQVQARRHSALAPSLSRCQHHVEHCLESLRRAHSAVLFEDPAEILAIELRNALDALAAMLGTVYEDDLLDRIFSRFCIGK